MLVDWIYGVPTWEMGAVVVAFVVGLALLGLVVTHFFLRVDLRRQHNEFAGFTSALAGVIFAVLLAFIAIAVWESFGRAAEAAKAEAALAGDLWRDAINIPEPLRTQLLDDVRDYVDTVLTKEWPSMAQGMPIGDDGWAPLFKFHQQLVTVHTSSPLQTAIITETLTRLNSLYDTRRERILLATEHLDPTVWAVVLLGTFITITFTYLFGMERLGMHMLMTGLLATTLALIIVLILAFDYPFRGEVQVTPDAFRDVRHNMEMAGVKFPGDEER